MMGVRGASGSDAARIVALWKRLLEHHAAFDPHYALRPEAGDEEKGIRIFTVGLGDMDRGARIPVADDDRRNYLIHEGQQVWSKLNGEILRQVAGIRPRQEL